SGTTRLPAQSRALILAAARDMLRGGSFETFSMGEVAARAFVTRRTLYNQFLSKDDLYRASREALLHELAEIYVDDIPPRISTSDGLRYFAQACFDLVSDERSIELVLSTVRDSEAQPWLVRSYQRVVRDRLVRTCELFVLQRTRRTGITRENPRHIAEQFVAVIEAMAIGPDIFGGARLLRPNDVAERLNVVANAYGSMLESDAPATDPGHASRYAA
ncbi:MAG: TetR/AcrR family transcriptional regulator, partial [Sphingopyxis sp.]